MKDYILNCNGEDARDIMLIRLHMWEIQMNYKKETESILNPLCERMEDTTACNRMWTRKWKYV